MNDKKKEWQKKIKNDLLIEEKLFEEPLLNTLIGVYAPKHIRIVFEPYIEGLMAILLFKQMNPELSHLIDEELKKHAIEILTLTDSLMKEKEKYR